MSVYGDTIILGDGSLIGSAQFSNKLTNPNFSINQRVVAGTVVLAAGAYGHDRWKAGAGGCTYTFATVANVTILTISAGTLQQIIEGANLQSATHYLSWTGTATGRVDSGSYGATGLSATAVGGTNQTIEFTTGTLSLPRYNQSAISSIQFLPIGLELFICQRYLPAFSIGNGFFAGIGQCTSTTAVSIVLPLPVTARVPPTNITVTGTGSVTSAAGGPIGLNTITFSAGTTNSLTIAGSSGGGLVAGNATIFYSNSAPLIILPTGCEL